MRMLRLPMMLSILAFTGAGCANLPFAGRGAATSAPASAPAAPVLGGPAQSAASFDTVSEAQKAAAREAAAAAPRGGELGEVTVGLGDPADPGLWVKSALVTAEGPGTARTASGAAIAVTLRPLGSDGGAQISLAALRALGLPLAGLSPVILARAG